MIDRYRKIWLSSFLLMIGFVLLSGCGGKQADTPPENLDPDNPPIVSDNGQQPDDSDDSEQTDNANQEETDPLPDPEADDPDAIQVDVQPDSLTVLVNKQYGLPEDYEPEDLVYPDVHFIFDERIEKRMMRQTAATALEQLFSGAKSDGIFLGGVSAYRSYATQKALFDRYVREDGEEKAKTYSAMPGHSEHETGLAIDVSGSTGKCAASDCFADTEEAVWLAAHAWEYGFIIRYPEGKDDITGYQYEPWHLRYVGKEIAKVIHEQDITLEEYYNAVPVLNQ